MDKILETTLQEFSSLPNYLRSSMQFQRYACVNFSFYVPDASLPGKDAKMILLPNHKVISDENIIFSGRLGKFSNAAYNILLSTSSLPVPTVTPLLKELEVLMQERYDPTSLRYSQQKVSFQEKEYPIYVPVGGFYPGYSKIEEHISLDTVLEAPNRMLVPKELQEFTLLPLKPFYTKNSLYVVDD